MLIVAIRAFHQSFVHLMVECPRELLLGLLMAAVTKLRLFLFQELLALFGVVWIVAIGATYAILQVSRSSEVAMFFTILVAVQTT